MNVTDNFNKGVQPYWNQVISGKSYIKCSESSIRLGITQAIDQIYSDAQIDDYTMLARQAYRWRPPLKMTVRARFSLGDSFHNKTNNLKGTAGFGFWNNPFSLDGKVHTLPEAVWFFYSAPPSNMALVPGIPGWGWKAQVVHTNRFGALASILPTAVGIGYGKITSNYTFASHWMKRLAGAEEMIIQKNMKQWHTYSLEWHKNKSIFYVDDKKILETNQTPSQPLGFVAWLDNQYAVATPTGVLKFGMVNSGSEWMDIDFISIKKP